MIRRTHGDLRELARGVHPAVLADRGLVESVEARAVQLPLGVRIDARNGALTARYPAEIELAAYFVISEGLTNAVKHSRAPEVVVRVNTCDGRLVVEVVDTGRGFDPERVTGSGLAGLRDRLQALGGELRVEACPGGGARLRGILPARDRADA